MILVLTCTYFPAYNRDIGVVSKICNVRSIFLMHSLCVYIMVVNWNMYVNVQGQSLASMIQKHSTAFHIRFGYRTN